MSPVREAALYFIELSYKDDMPITQLKLQKLLYFALGWSYVWNGEALFPEEIEAWHYGPMCPNIYNEYKKYGRNTIPYNHYEKCILSDKEKKVIEKTWKAYGRYTPFELVNMTHQQAPWIDAINGDYQISHDAIKNFFVENYLF